MIQSAKQRLKQKVFKSALGDKHQLVALPLNHLAAVLQQHHAAIQVLARHVETLEEEASWRALQ